MVLVGQFRAQQRRLAGIEVRQHDGHGLVPPGQAAQVGLVAVVATACQVHARQHVAHGGAMHRAGGQLALAAQLAHHGGRLAAHAVQNVAVAVGARVGHGHAAVRQVLHQVQVERQLPGRQALEQRQNELALVAGQEIVGVLDAAFDAAQRHQLAEVQEAQQIARLFIGDFSENGHRSAGGMRKNPEEKAGAGGAAPPARHQNFRTFQTRGPVLVSAPLRAPVRPRAPSGDCTS